MLTKTFEVFKTRCVHLLFFGTNLYKIIANIYFMKNLMSASFVFIVIAFLASCSSSNKALISKTDLKGTWEVTATEIDGANDAKLNITSFEDAALHCFNNSRWYFPNNGYGNYKIMNTNCNAGERPIIWSQSFKNGKTYLGFKRMDGVKKIDAKRVEEGYSLEIVQAEKDHFTARTPVDFEGTTIYIVYHFQRV